MAYTQTKNSIKTRKEDQNVFSKQVPAQGSIERLEEKRILKEVSIGEHRIQIDILIPVSATELKYIQGIDSDGRIVVIVRGFNSEVDPRNIPSGYCSTHKNLVESHDRWLNNLSGGFIKIQRNENSTSLIVGETSTTFRKGNHEFIAELLSDLFYKSDQKITVSSKHKIPEEHSAKTYAIDQNSNHTVWHLSANCEQAELLVINRHSPNGKLAFIIGFENYLSNGLDGPDDRKVLIVADATSDQYIHIQMAEDFEQKFGCALEDLRCGYITYDAKTNYALLGEPAYAFPDADLAEIATKFSAAFSMMDVPITISIKRTRKFKSLDDVYMVLNDLNSSSDLTDPKHPSISPDLIKVLRSITESNQSDFIGLYGFIEAIEGNYEVTKEMIQTALDTFHMLLKLKKRFEICKSDPSRSSESDRDQFINGHFLSEELVAELENYLVCI